VFAHRTLQEDAEARFRYRVIFDASKICEVTLQSNREWGSVCQNDDRSVVDPTICNASKLAGSAKLSRGKRLLPIPFRPEIAKPCNEFV